MKFKGCKNLDFDKDNYSCELVGISNHAEWERQNPDGEIELCQFCKLRGRLNNPYACIDKINSYCNNYEEVEHEVV